MINIKSIAKINMFLNITGKISNGQYAGYHSIQSVFWPLHGLYDELYLEECQLSSSVKMFDEDDNVIDDYGNNNSAIKALYMMQEEFHDVIGLKHYNISIKKRIPIGSGLGGSSTNAASVMLLLSQIWGLWKHYNKVELDQRLLLESRTIGADVAFFLSPQISLVEGIGEKITHLKTKIIPHILLIYPGFASNTKDVYASHIISKTNPLSDLEHEILHGQNSLYKSAISIYPEIENLVNYLMTLDGCVSAKMSGSGSSCFALFKTANELNNAYIKAKHDLSSKNYLIWSFPDAFYFIF